VGSASEVAVGLGLIGALCTLGGILWRMASAMERTRLMVERLTADCVRIEASVTRIDGERVSQRVCSERMHGLRRDLTQQSMIHHLGGIPPAPGTQGDG
jgi:hypothetical protein